MRLFGNLERVRGRERAAHFQDPAKVLAVIHEAKDQGAGGMMMSTHERAGSIAGMIAVIALRFVTVKLPGNVVEAENGPTSRPPVPVSVYVPLANVPPAAGAKP